MNTVRYVGNNKKLCVSAIARNLVVGKTIKVCSSVASYDDATKEAISKWNTALNPASGAKTVGRDILEWSEDRNCMANDPQNEMSIIIVKNTKCSGTGCAVPVTIKTDSNGNTHPDHAYIGQSKVEINVDEEAEEDEMTKSINQEARRRMISSEDKEKFSKFEADFKSALIAHEIGHLIGITHPKAFGSYAISGCSEGNPLTVPLMKQGAMEGKCGDGNLTSLDTGYYEGIYGPNPVTGLSANSPTSGRVNLSWNSNDVVDADGDITQHGVHVEKEFEVQRCTSFFSQVPACTKTTGSWVKVKTVSANTSPTSAAPIVLRGGETGSNAREMFRVISRTDALTTAKYESEAATAGLTITVTRGTAAPPSTETPTTPVGGQPETPGDDEEEEEEEGRRREWR